MSSNKSSSDPMRRLKEVADDAGKIVIRHAFLKPDEASVILREIQRLQAEIKKANETSL
jgi:hypothetical protein